LLAFPGVPRIFPADAALGLSARIIGEKNTAVNRIFGRSPTAKPYILTKRDPETIHIFEPGFLTKSFAFARLVWHSRPRRVLKCGAQPPRLRWWRSGHLWLREILFQTELPSLSRSLALAVLRVSVPPWWGLFS
jgi:hypothetical protein